MARCGPAVYPRTRGATRRKMGGWHHEAGLSPHARGNRLGGECRQGVDGSIPARAGQPWRDPECAGRCAVYPRTRGATPPWLPPLRSVEGLSPHARGNLSAVSVSASSSRSIPARAGQPGGQGPAGCILGVYPRTRGATIKGFITGVQTIGLSPHARGNLCPLSRPQRHRGSIPARAGQPGGCFPPCRPRRVYPRTRGATDGTIKWLCLVCGLSPHARGNQCVAVECAAGVGSIPARAGQPLSDVVFHCGPEVYPRTRGATAGCSCRNSSTTGLSPHARGNRRGCGLCGGRLGSIPARAGQPRSPARRHGRDSVYPRTRGATMWHLAHPDENIGLSPHARGNPLRLWRSNSCLWSIPARAGQPGAYEGPGRKGGVYPRTRGATTLSADASSTLKGLSPHARGNPTPQRAYLTLIGSIPARAGQPSVE